jgi:hypothetical protein
MVPTFSQSYGAGDLRIGIASWDKGDFKSRSIKYAYPDKSGKVSRGCPELPFDVLVEMIILAHKQKELSVEQVERLKYHLR